MIAAGVREKRRQQVLNSPFVRHISYDFVAPIGKPAQVILSEVLIQTEDSKSFSVLKVTDESNRQTSGYSAPNIFHLESLAQLEDLTLDSLNHAVQGKGMRGLRSIWHEAFDLSNVPDVHRWMGKQIVSYFANGFFFSPFRHSARQQYASTRTRLASDGSDLPVVLNYLSGKDRKRFEFIEGLLHNAVPEVGTLHPGLVANAAEGVPGPQLVEITFETADRYDVRLREMGGGVEQLLMVATTFHRRKKVPRCFWRSQNSTCTLEHSAT